MLADGCARVSAKHLLKSPHAGPQNAEDNKKAVSLLQLTACFCCGAPEEIRTPGLQVRSLLLYPAELRARREKLCIAIALPCQTFLRKKINFYAAALIGRPAFDGTAWQPRPLSPHFMPP